MIEVKNLYKRYGKVLAVKNLNFSIKEGEIVGFLGPNGAGKSTTMNILTGYLSLTSGSVSVAGYNIMENPKQAKRHIGYLPELPPLYTDMTVKEYLEFMFDLKKVTFPKQRHLDEICSLVKIENVKDRLIKNLSKGYRQRVGIAQALIGNPEVLILDEPTVGLDPKQIIEIRTLIKLLGKNHTVILSSHILQEIQAVCERIIVINNGELIADGTPSELAQSLTKDNSVIIRAEAEEKEISKLLQNAEYIESFEFTGSLEANTVDFKITPKPETDIRKLLFNEFYKNNINLLSLYTNNPSLEEVFLKLTSSGVTKTEEN